MQRALEVTSQSPPPPMSKLVPSEKGDNVILNDDPVMDVHNLSFENFQKKIVQAWRKNFPDDHASPALMKQRVIVLDVKNHPATIPYATFS